MSGHQNRSTGTRPKTQRSQNQGGDRAEREEENGNLRDISTLFRDYERRKNSLSVLQNQLQQQDATSTNSGGLQRIRPPDFSLMQPSETQGNVYKQNGVKNLGHRNRTRGGRNRGSDSLSQDNISIQEELEQRHGVELGTINSEQRSHNKGKEELEYLRSRVRELQDLVLRYDEAEPKNSNTSDISPARSSRDHSLRETSSRGSDLAPGQDVHQHGFERLENLDSEQHESEPDLVERNLALLTAQYEKSQGEEMSSYPPAMSILNHWKGQDPVRSSFQRTSSNHSRTNILSRRDENEGRRNEDVLEKELRDRRDQLEELIKKTANSGNVNETNRTLNKNDFPRNSRDSSTGLRSKEVNTRPFSVHIPTHHPHPPHPPLASHPPHPPVRNSSSRDPRRLNNSQRIPDLGYISILQDEVRKLTDELDRLSLASTQHSNQTNSATTQYRDNNSGDGSVLGIPLELQVHQLTLSLNQVYQVLWSLQREVGTLAQTVGTLQARAGNVNWRNSDLTPSDVWNTGYAFRTENSGWIGNHIGERFSGTWNGEGPSWSQDGNMEQFSPFPSRELWNSLQNSPGFNNIGPLHEPRNLNLLRDRNQSNLSDPDSGVSSNALNNQVSPGIRANNYYDNFRSFSRQNRFSAPPLASTSRPVRAAESLPANNTTAGYNRTRKKYKINREQNRDQNSTRKRQQSNQDNAVGAAFIRNEGVNVYNPPEDEVNIEQEHSSIDNIAKNIYTQIHSIISRNDTAPEFLANLLDELTLISSQENLNLSPLSVQRREYRSGNLNLDIRETSSESSEDGTERPLPRQSRSKVAAKRLSSHAPLQAVEIDSSDTGLNNISSIQNQILTNQPNHQSPAYPNRITSPNPNHLSPTQTSEQSPSHQNLPTSSTFSNAEFPSRRSSHNRPNENNLFSPLTNQSSPNYTDAASALNPGASSLNPGGAPDRSSFLPPLLPLPYFGSHQSSWSSNNSQQNYAVPKNQQKNLMSKERDSRRIQGAQERGLPRNMQSSEVPPDQDGFINIQLQLPMSYSRESNQADIGEESDPPTGGAGQASISDLTEAELAEADQDRSQGEDISQPSMEIPHHSLEVSHHFREQNHPVHSEQSQSIRDHSQPSREQSQPSREQSQPSREQSQPSREQSQPSREANQQSRNQNQASRDSSFPTRDGEVGGIRIPCQIGLDRVPIRLPSSHDLEARRQLEDEAVASLVEEVLASSPELANSVAADYLPDLS
ncbi:uncharacterized protein LOC111707734 isoform X3 [Eurytemora carolleeae]|uniref:uncharacterized protein LOC111707734 isoform X3 n=1 Tax=Eurytemora carolleeae TaxID=1294199 RepID=UPI000C773FB4|nr:uncharacterized protein LOC111707734 isoform X3 [Eurytemora carolleeae]|eukprot:XP_023336659.1 uncharacterized protein LOC111707734 isoform X3 [Eurytemora affinis]